MRGLDFCIVIVVSLKPNSITLLPLEFRMFGSLILYVLYTFQYCMLILSSKTQPARKNFTISSHFTKLAFSFSGNCLMIETLSNYLLALES